MRYALNFLAVLCAALFWTILFSHQAHAAEASWQNGNLMYDNKSYQGGEKADRATADKLGIPEGSPYYTHIDSTVDPKKAHVIYFSPGDDLKDAASAQHKEYTYDDSGVEDNYSQATRPAAITIDKESYETGGTREETSCAITGIGYILCPIMSFLADAMDKMYDVIKRFLEVRPLSTDRDSGLYKAWAIMLSIANVLFIVGFLVVIYSYVTNQGVKQYDLRNIIPRLIIAAILINVSYYICALAVDASNIAGSSMQDVFNNIRKDVAGNSATDPSAWSWAAVTTLVLSAGTIGAGAVALGAYGTAALHLLTPVLVGAGFAILVALIVLAARQALITVLIIAAPLAFAAFILPSTQKYFEKWKSLFLTMLMVYPMFAVLFGGSQLAATLIAQNASSAIVIIFAMFIQVVPLVITPFLIKFSGGLLGRLAGMVNNPTKGLSDRAKNWSAGKRDLAKDRRIADGARGAALARRFAENKMDDENRKKRYETMSRNRYNASARGRQSMIEQALANDRLSATDKLNESAYEEMKRTDPSVRLHAVQLKIADMELNVNKAKMDTYLEDLQSKAGVKHHGLAGTALGSTAARMAGLSHEHHAAANALQLSKEQSKLEYSQDMVRGAHADALQAAAAGIAGDKGKAQAAARAVQEMRTDFGKSSSAMKEMMEHFKVTGAEVERMADPSNTADVVKLSKDGKTKFTFKAGDEYTTDAAIEALYEKKGNYASMKKVLVQSGLDSHEDYLTTIISGVGSGMTKKAPWLGGKNIDIITQGKIQSEQDLTNMVRATIADGKFKSEWMAIGDSTGLNDIAAIVNDNMNHNGLNAKQSAGYAKRIASMQEMARNTLNNKNLEGSLTDEARTQLKMIAGDIRFKKS